MNNDEKVKTNFTSMDDLYFEKSAFLLLFIIFLFINYVYYLHGNLNGMFNIIYWLCFILSAPKFDFNFNFNEDSKNEVLYSYMLNGVEGHKYSVSGDLY